MEPDTGVTADGELVVIHDRTVNGSHCVDTAPVSPGDALFPYVGKRVHQLTLRQLKTIDCGTRTVAEFPRQVAVPGERIPTLREVFAAVRASGRTDVRLNIETKISPTVPDTADYRVFTGALVTAIKDAGYLSRATIQSFDWSPAYFHGPTVPRLRERYGLKVIPYPVNDAAIMQRLIDLRVDGIITDDPDLLVLVARRNGLR